MLRQAIHWMLIAGTVIDALLLARLLGLKLQKIYLFITLDCVLEVFIDVIGVWLGWDSKEYARVNTYWRFLYAVIYPLVAWDVFEEVKARVAKIRQVEALRMLMSLVVISVVSVVMIATFSGDEDPSAPAIPDVLGIFLWAGACLASLVFIFKVYKQVRSQNEDMPTNTFVWSVYYKLSLGGSLAVCALGFAGIPTKSVASDVIDLVLVIYGIAYTGWGILRLKSVPPEGKTVANPQL